MAKPPSLKFSLLDFKLGLRMLRKYPGLTVVAGAAIAFAIAIGAVSFEFLMQVARPSIPLPDADRIVALQLRDAARAAPEDRLLHDFGRWQSGLTSVEDLAVYRTVHANLAGSGGAIATVTAAQITASGLRTAGVAPLLGRPLLASDEEPRAPPVIVIGERVWRTHFGSDPGILTRAVRLDGEPHMIVGVMPERFGFPLHHDAWIPFPLSGADHAPLDGPAVTAFGRLARDATIEQARAELAAVLARTRHDSPGTHEHLVASVIPYAETWVEPDALFLAYFGNSFMVVFLLLVYANVGLLMFARAATRDSEIVVRSALGASRGRVVIQLFTEALVLGSLGAAIGIALARFGMGWGFWLIEENRVELPFWFQDTLSPLTLIYAVGLTILAAVVAGVLPALRVTRGLGTQLRAAGTGAPRFGRGWTFVIVAQVAFTAAFFPLLIGVAAHARSARAVEIGVPAEEYLTARLLFSDQPADGAPAARPRDGLSLELKRRLAEEPGVRAVTFSHQLPGMYHPDPAIEVEGLPAVTESGASLHVQQATVDVDYFDAMGARVQSGRGFHPADAGSDTRVVIVNQSFVREMLGGRSPLGRRMRYFETADDGGQQPGPWHEIVGVVDDLAMSVNPDLSNAAGVYHPLVPGSASYLRMAVHLDIDPVAFAPRLRALAAAVDPSLRLDDVRPLDALIGSYLDAVTMWLRIMLGTGGVALVLALAGIYSITSYTVARRTREIGVRIALGSGRARVIVTMFSRALAQIAVGIALGTGLFLSLMGSAAKEGSSLRWWDNVAVVLAYVVLLAVVCLIACAVPAGRALAVQPTEALKAEA